MEKLVALVKVKEEYPLNYHDIEVREKNKNLETVEIKYISIPNIQNPGSMFLSFYKVISRFK